MNPAQGVPINCPNCGQRFAAMVESIIDGEHDPAGKARFLSGRTNVIQCPNCGVTVQMAIPLIYHDHSKDLLLLYFPQNLNIPTPERERIIGEMTRTIMNSLPQNERRGYLLNPITPLTYEGMVEIVLEKDGITKEMINEQREKMKLVEQFLKADPADYEELVETYDPEMDQEFFQMFTISAEAAMASGRQRAAEEVLQRRDMLLSLSSYGKEALASAQEQEAIIMEVADWLQKQGRQISIDSFLDYVESIGQSDDHLQALVGLVRPALNQQFFVALDQRIKDSDDPDYLQDVKNRLSALVARVDQQQTAMIQQAQAVLQQLLNTADLDAAIQDVLPMVDDLFMQVVAANIQAAEQRGDLLLAARLKNVYEKVVEQIQASAPPAVRFINELLQLDPLDAKLTITERAADYGPELVMYMDVVLQNLASQGQEEMVEVLSELREAAANIVGEGE